MLKSIKLLLLPPFAAVSLSIVTNVSLFAQSNVITIDASSGLVTTTVTATSPEPNIYVTKDGVIIASTGPAIDLGSYSGYLIIEKGHSAATGLVKANSGAAIVASIAATPNRDVRSIVNYGTIERISGDAIDNSGSVTDTHLSFINYGTLIGNYHGGAGVDSVHLMRGSTTQGNIIFGGSDNTFEIRRGVTLDGSISGGVNNTYSLYDNSRITGSLTGGSGNNNILFLDPVAKTRATVQGAFDFDGTIYTTLQKTPGTNNSQDNYLASQLFSNGNMNLNSSKIMIESLAGTGTLAKNDEFLVFSTQGTLGGLPSVITPPGLEMLTFGLRDDGNSTYITVANRENFADHVNASDQFFASSIDTMIDNHAMASKSLDRAFGELQLGTKANTRQFFANSNPSQFLSLPVSGMQTTQQMTFGIVDRLSGLRERVRLVPNRRPGYVPTYGPNHDPNRGPNYVPNYGAADYYGQNCDASGRSIEYGCSRNYDVFARVFGGYHKEDMTSDNLGYRSASQGIQIGIDRRVDSQSFLGISLGYADISVDIRNTNNSANDLMLRFGGYYTRLFSNCVFLDAEVTYGHHDNTLDRYYSINTLGGRHVASKYQAHDIASYIGLGRKFVGRETFYLTPLVSAQHIYYRQEAFDERGAYGLYHFERQGLNSVNMRAALRIGQERWGGKNMGFEFEAGYNVELGDDIRIEGGWIGGPADLFSMSRPSATENGFYGAWKLNFRPSDHCRLFARYLGEGSKGGFSHGAEFGGVWSF